MDINDTLAKLHKKEFCEEIEKICKKYENVPLDNMLISVKDGSLIHTNNLEQKKIKQLYFGDEISSDSNEMDLQGKELSHSLSENTKSISSNEYSNTEVFGDLQNSSLGLKLPVFVKEKQKSWSPMSIISQSHFKAVKTVSNALNASKSDFSSLSNSSYGSDNVKYFDEKFWNSSSLSNSSLSDVIGISPTSLQSKFISFGAYEDDNSLSKSSAFSAQVRKSKKISTRFVNESNSSEYSDDVISIIGSPRHSSPSKSVNQLPTTQNRPSKANLKGSVRLVDDSYSSGLSSSKNSIINFDHQTSCSKHAKKFSTSNFRKGHCKFFITSSESSSEEDILSLDGVSTKPQIAPFRFRENKLSSSDDDWITNSPFSSTALCSPVRSMRVNETSNTPKVCNKPTLPSKQRVFNFSSPTCSSISSTSRTKSHLLNDKPGFDSNGGSRFFKFNEFDDCRKPVEMCKQWNHEGKPRNTSRTNFKRNYSKYEEFIKPCCVVLETLGSGES